MNETIDTPEELFEYQMETLRLATEAQRLANTNWDNVWPWRYFRWRRINAEVQEQLIEINRRANVGEVAFAVLFNQAIRKT